MQRLGMPVSDDTILRQLKRDAAVAQRNSEIRVVCSEIARRTGYERRSVTKWLKFEAPPDRRRAALNPTSPWYFEAFLAQCWKDGNRRGRHLFHNVKQRGPTGSFANLERLLGAWRRAEREQADNVPPPRLSRSRYEIRTLVMRALR